jgi:hypothetical protein
MRGRNNNNNNNNGNNNRKGPNPLTRNYESNGPDVKIRGSAQQIAEKYATLARDAQSSGDRVMAENYLQHAEHYNRIIAAAMAQMPIQQQQSRDDFDADMDDERDEDSIDNNVAEVQVQQPQPQPVVNGTGPQPDIEGTPAEVALNPEAAEGQPREGRRERRPNRNERRPRHQEQQAETAPTDVVAVVEQPQPDVVVTEAVVAEVAPATEAAEGEVVAAPRRGRRPRRGERAATEVQGEAGDTPAAEPAAVEG